LNSRNTSNLSSLPFLVVVVDLPGLECASEALDAFASPPEGYAYAIVAVVKRFSADMICLREICPSRSVRLV